MTEAQRRASITRHAPFLTPTERQQFMPTTDELIATERTNAIAKDYGSPVLSTITVYLIALLVCVLVGASWLLDGPSETDAAASVALDLNDAIADARAARKDLP
ncbi:hypothetical protein [Variovorax sp. GT1P44]|uniref:hypothetical protein n=1 Tax=Variovorax sp. GT1P44 TaxID=3443742 RepID=UPI003F44C4DA